MLILRAFFILNLTLLWPIYSNASSLHESLAAIAEKVTPAVVSVTAEQQLEAGRQPNNPLDDPYELFREYFGLPEQSRRVTSRGSGFIIDSQGYIVTNCHVIAKAEQITVTIGNNSARTYRAKIIGQDAVTDLALIKIESKEPLHYLELGDSDAAKVGDPVIAVGSPYGLELSVTSGIISAKSRQLGAGNREYLQTDAALNQGNSGGPLCDLTGRVIGVNAVIYSPSGGSIGLGFAIPAATVKQVIGQLKEKGKIIRGWLGLTLQNLGEKELAALGIPEGIDISKGRTIVTGVVPNSSAFKAGLQRSDIIIQYRQQEIHTAQQLARLVGETAIGQEVEVKVVRQGKVKTVSATINPQPSSISGQPDEGPEPDAVRIADLGITIKTLDETLSNSYGIRENRAGVIVTQIETSSILVGTGIKIGDVISQVNQIDVNSSQEFADIWKKLKERSASYVVFQVLHRLGGTEFIGLSLDRLWGNK